MSKRLTKAQFQYIEDELRHYYDTKKELEQLRLNVITGSIYQEYSDENIGGSSSGNISNQVEQRVTLLDMDIQIQRMNKVVRVIDKVIANLNENDRMVVKLRYWSRERYTWEHIGMKSHMGRATAIRHRDVVIKEIGRFLGF
ncbi:DUF722 domain-containing protein [Listeria monocytogenes]|nr:DUF722 domain-containing protein [Listeria monocytogenes]